MTTGNKSSPPSAPSEEEIRRQAADWIVRRDRGLSSTEERDLSLWLEADSRHRQAFQRRSRMWNDFDLLNAPSDQPAAARRHAIHRPRSIAWGALAASLALAAALWILYGPSSDTDRFLIAEEAAAEGYLRQTLPDGSVIELNRGSQAEARFTDRERHIRLLSGEAYFTVASNPQRPFRVTAGAAVVEAIGTAFNVSLEPDSVEVLVTEGRVKLQPALQAPQEGTQSPQPPPVLELAAAQATELAPNRLAANPRVRSLSPTELEERLAWKSPLMEFAAQPLSEVVREINRYNDTPIRIADPALGRRAITATLRPQSLDSFKQLLEVAMGIEVEQRPDAIILRDAGRDP